MPAKSLDAKFVDDTAKLIGSLRDLGARKPAKRTAATATPAVEKILKDRARRRATRR